MAPACRRRSAERGSLQALCVLLVEDEPLIQLILAEELADAGFPVCQANNGDEAATLIENSPVPFTLLITDLHMPGTRDGISVARLMRQRDPLIPVIYVSGRPDVFNEMAPLGENEVFLAKPFLPSDLLQVARRLLGEGGSARDRSPAR